MNAVAKKVSGQKTFREREHRFSKLPFKDVLRERAKELDLSNIELAQMIGYEKPNVIAMIKSGSMRMSPSYAKHAARALQLDPTMILMKLLEESDAGLADAISSVVGTRMVTENEMKVIYSMREALEGSDADMTTNKEFMTMLKEHCATTGGAKLQMISNKLGTVNEVETVEAAFIKTAKK